MAHRIYPLLVLTLFLNSVFADEFNCKVTLNNREYNIAELYGPHPLSRKMRLPPSEVVQDLTFDLCSPLEKDDSKEAWDQCPQGTWACLVETNKRGEEQDRIVRVIPIATGDKLTVTYRALSGDNEGINLVMHGPPYPPANENPPPEIVQEQSLDVDVICPPNGAESEAPTFQSYDGKVVKVQWRHRVMCSNSKPSDGNVNPGVKKAGSGIGYFFLVLLIAIIGYFVIGAYYNYNNFGASGWDLIPHRDFWREVPYLLQDVFSHLCSLGRSRRGYVQV